MREFAATQRYPLRDTAAHALRELLTSPAVGRVWLVEAAGSAVGYIVLTFGFSLEYGGRGGFVDGVFVVLSWGGGGGRGGGPPLRPPRALLPGGRGAPRLR